MELKKNIVLVVKKDLSYKRFLEEREIDSLTELSDKEYDEVMSSNKLNFSRIVMR